jgi:hypothetical protein
MRGLLIRSKNGYPGALHEPPQQTFVSCAMFSYREPCPQFAENYERNVDLKRGFEYG